MRVRIFGLLLSLALLSAATLRAQTSGNDLDTAPAPSARFPAKWYPSANPYTSTEPPVKGVPYTAQMVTTNVIPKTEEYPDGTHAFSAPWYRDSAGRTRTEEPGGAHYRAPDGVEHDNTHKEIEVNDPVSHCQFRWSESSTGPKIATVTCLPMTIHYTAKSRYSWIEAQTTIKDRREDLVPLGHRIIEGFDAVGMRRIPDVQTPAKAGPSGEAPVSAVEFWYSPQLHELIRFGPVPPQAGLPTFELKEIQLEKPDPRLFYPPPDYRILAPGEMPH